MWSLNFFFFVGLISLILSISSAEVARDGHIYELEREQDTNSNFQIASSVNNSGQKLLSNSVLAKRLRNLDIKEGSMQTKNGGVEEKGTLQNIDIGWLFANDFFGLLNKNNSVNRAPVFAEEILRAANFFQDTFKAIFPEELQDFIDAVFNLGQKVDIDAALTGAWIKDFQRIIDRIALTAEEIQNSDQASHGTGLKLIRIAELSKELSKNVPFTQFLDFLTDTWVQNMFTRFERFGSLFREFIENGNLSFAEEYLKNSQETIENMKLLRDYIKEKSAETLPGFVVQSLKEYVLALRQMFTVAHDGIMNNKLEHSDEDLINMREKQASMAFSQLSVLQKRSKLTNALQAFQNLVLDPLSNSLEPLGFNTAIFDNIVSSFAMMPITFPPFYQFDNSTQIQNDIDKASQTEDMMVELTKICKSKSDAQNNSICRSVAAAIGHGDSKANEGLPRALQAYFEADALLDQPITTLYSAISAAALPRINAVLAKTPQMFPLAFAATANTVDAIVDSSHIVADSMLNAANELAERLRGSSPSLLRQFPPPAIF